MAQGYVRGPTHIYCGVGGGDTPVYLGTAERSPRISIRPSFSPYWNDLAGQKVPYDWGFDGEEGFVVADLTRWNQATLAALQARPRGPFLSTPGISLAGEIGTMMFTENFAVPLWLLFPYSTKPAYATEPQGYHFFGTFLVGPDDLDNNNTGMAKVRCVWYCGRYGTINQPVFGANWSLYDNDCSGLPAID